MKYKLSELLYLKSQWETYFSREYSEGLKSRDLIFDTKSGISYDDLKYAESINFVPRTNNIIAPLAEKLIESLSGRKRDVEIKFELDQLLGQRGINIDQFFDNSRFELDDAIKDIVCEGYTVLLVDTLKRKFIRIPSDYKPFFDRLAHSKNFNDGGYCGYSVQMSYDALLRAFPEAALNEFKTAYAANTQDYTSKILSIRVYKMWVKEGNKVNCYNYTEFFKFNNKVEPVFESLPMVFISNLGYKDTNKIKLIRVGEETKDLQKMHNFALSYVEYQIANSQNTFLTTTDTVPTEFTEDYTDIRSIVKRYIPQNAIDPKSSEPTVIKASPVQPVANEMILKTQQLMSQRWLNEIDVATSSKYDSLSVLSEKMRTSQNSGISMIRRYWEQGLHALINVLISLVLGPDQNKISMTGSHYVKIGEDEQRQENILIEMYMQFGQYLVSSVPTLAPIIMTEVLRIKGDAGAKNMLDAISRQQKMMEIENQKTADKPPTETVKAQADLARAQIAAEAQIKITQMQIQAKLLEEKNKMEIEHMKLHKAAEHPQKEKPAQNNDSLFKD